MRVAQPIVSAVSEEIYKPLPNNLLPSASVFVKSIPEIDSSLPNTLFLDVASIYLPHQSIGGDFFDFIQLNNDEFLWCVADVSGKGISAALIMANFQASLRALVSLDIGLQELVKRLNKSVYKNTLFYHYTTL